MTVAVVTPWHDHPELADDYYAAIALGPEPDELIVVDNGSDPPAFASVRLDWNTGFAHASNVGLHAATAEKVVFLNNDIAATERGWLRCLADAIEPGVLAGAKLRHDVHGQVDGRPMPYLDGWCLGGMRDELLELGGFDEELTEPAYYSDNLLCLEARARGMRLREVRVGLEHKIGVTSGGPTATVEEAILHNYARYSERARELLAAAA